MKKDTYKTKFGNKQSNSYIIINDLAKSNFTMTRIENLYYLIISMLSRALSVMFKDKQLFTKNYLFLLLITLFSVHFNSFEVIRSQSLKDSKSYQIIK